MSVLSASVQYRKVSWDELPYSLKILTLPIKIGSKILGVIAKFHLIERCRITTLVPTEQRTLLRNNLLSVYPTLSL
jgi:hypothetical protein